jgi:hypothetical protein
LAQCNAIISAIRRRLRRWSVVVLQVVQCWWWFRRQAAVVAVVVVVLGALIQGAVNLPDLVQKIARRIR